MSSFGPAPECPINLFVHSTEGPLGGGVLIVIGPAPKHRVEFANQHFGWDCQAGFDALSDFGQQRFHVTLTGLGGNNYIVRRAPDP